jgi:hypothetical protein
LSKKPKPFWEAIAGGFCFPSIIYNTAEFSFPASVVSGKEEAYKKWAQTEIRLRP